MKISKTIQKEEVIEIELVTPAWFKMPAAAYSSTVQFYQVNSEKDIIEIQLAKNFTTINRMPITYYTSPYKIFESEVITEDEFNQAMSDAFSRITATPGIVATVPDLAVAV